jgi:hypothetical protein
MIDEMIRDEYIMLNFLSFHETTTTIPWSLMMMNDGDRCPNTKK